jgi:hypothetical protein
MKPKIYSEAQTALHKLIARPAMPTYTDLLLELIRRTFEVRSQYGKETLILELRELIEKLEKRNKEEYVKPLIQPKKSE